MSFYIAVASDPPCIGIHPFSAAMPRWIITVRGGDAVSEKIVAAWSRARISVPMSWPYLTFASERRGQSQNM